MRRRTLFPGAVDAIVAAAVKRTAQTQTACRPARIAVLNDVSGLYSGHQSCGSVFAAEPAVADFGGRAPGVPVEVVFAGQQDKPDISAAAARRWLDLDDVGAILDVPNSAVVRAVAEFCLEKNKDFVGSPHAAAPP